MIVDDLKKLATGTTLFSLSNIISPRLLSLAYLLGLCAIGLWAITHLFASFALGFGAGLWGLIEIAVFGLLMFIALRVTIEAALVYFRTHTLDIAQEAAPTAQASLLDEVRGALEDLAAETPKPSEPAPTAKPVVAKKKPTTVRRTAKRTPAKRSTKPTAAQKPPAKSS